MTDILCTWLNDELMLSKRITIQSFAKDFSTGYLIGEVLNKNGLQEDFDQFSVATTMDARLNNFTRVEPVLQLLGIVFDPNTARDVMTEANGMATKLLYHMFVALKEKKRAKLTGTAMKTMRAAGPSKLAAIGSEMYKERLHRLTPRQTDLNLDRLSQQFYEHRLKLEATAFKDRYEEQEQIRKRHEEERAALIERSRVAKQKQTELLAKIAAATVEIPKPPQKTSKALAKKRQVKIAREAQETMGSIWEFEEKIKATMPASGDQDDQIMPEPDQYIPEETMAPATRKAKTLAEAEIIRPRGNSEYIGKIRRRLQEDAAARAERAKRRRKVLVDQLKAHEAMEEARREEVLVNRLMRQSQQERRIAVQLMQTRHEKDVIRNNRIARERQYEERRTKDFTDALDREAEMARLAKSEYAEQTMKDRELHDKIAAERAIVKYQKHYNICGEILDDVVDFSCKVAEYRELTEDLIPAKLYREWSALFTSGKPLYEQAAIGLGQTQEVTPEMVLEEERQQLLDEADFTEYKNMVGEWSPPEESGIGGPPRSNPVVGHIVQRLFNIVYPPTPPPTPPQFPPFPIKACVLGKFFSGKSTCCKQLFKNRRVEILCADQLLNVAIEAYRNNEEAPEEPEPPIESQGDPPTVATAVQVVAATPSSQQETMPTVEDSNKVEEPQLAETEMEEGKKKVDDGTEKGDTEKPVDEEKTATADHKSLKLVKSSSRGSRSTLITAKSSGSLKPNLSVRARLGGKAMKQLRKGKPVDEQILTDVLAEAIRQVPEGTGWILDGFPTTYSQAKLLEKALSGYDADAVENADKPGKKSGGKKKKSNLAVDPRPPPPPPEPVSGIDVVILVDTPDELCLRRSAGRYDAVQEGEVYHQEFKPPPGGSATGVGRQEKVIPTTDAAHDQEQVQQRLTGFQDAWSKMEKWFTKFGILQRVDGGLDVNSLSLEIEKILDDALDRLQGKPEEESMPVEVSETTEVKPPEPEPEPPVAEPLPEPPVKEEEETTRPGSRKSRKESGEKRSGSAGKRSGSTGSGKGKSKSPKKGGGKSPSPKRAASGKGSRPGSKKGNKKSPEPEPESVQPEVPPGPPPPEPGSEEWEFVDEPIEEELAKILAPYWEGLEDVYVNTSKGAFRYLRTEREAIIRYFYQIRQDYLAYLKRPDHKHQFVAQWQQDYNSVADDVREDEETKAELHDRVDDLRERLWSICDERKEQAEEEMTSIIQDGWLDDRLGVFTNYYVSLMQVEVDRLQDTMRLLKDYYKGMDGQIPDESKEEFARIPLVELPYERADSTFSEGESEHAIGKVTTPARKESVRTGSSGGKKSRSQKEAGDPDADSEKRHKIPLVPHRPTSAELAARDKKDKKPVKKDRQSAGLESESPAPPNDPDERLVFDALWTGLHAITAMLNAEIAAREAEEEAARKEEEEKQKKDSKAAGADKGKKGGKKSGKKSRSPSPKKGKKEEPPTEAPPPPEESEEEKEKKRIKQKMKEELFFSMNEEVESCKVRMMLIKVIASTVLQDLKYRGESTYKDMNDWLGARFLKEMESIDYMSELMRCYVEKGEKITHELVLQQEDFLIADDIKVVQTPSPPPIPPPTEYITKDQFTVNQLYAMYEQFTLIAPDGNMSIKAFIESVQDLVNLTQGAELIPEAWLNVTHSQLQEMAQALSPDGVYVDWRMFLVSLSQPQPRPSLSDLLTALSRYIDADREGEGYVTLEQFMEIDLWFSVVTPPESPINPQGSGPFNRLKALKRAYFDFFADRNQDTPLLQYTDMLMYFAADPDALEGFLRALSVATGTHMPRTHRIKDDQLVLIEAPVEDALTEQAEAATPATTMAGVTAGTPLIRTSLVGNDQIPEDALAAVVPIDALMKVLHHGERTRGDSHRFSVTADPMDARSKERLVGVYHALCDGQEEDTVPYRVLVEHPIIQDILTNFHRFKMPDVKSMLTNSVTGTGDYNDNISAKTPE